MEKMMPFTLVNSLQNTYVIVDVVRLMNFMVCMFLISCNFACVDMVTRAIVFIRQRSKPIF